MAALEGTNGYEKVLAIPDYRPEVRQANDDFDVVCAQAEAARDLLRDALADEWFVDEERKRLGKTCPHSSARPSRLVGHRFGDADDETAIRGACGTCLQMM